MLSNHRLKSFYNKALDNGTMQTIFIIFQKFTRDKESEAYSRSGGGPMGVSEIDLKMREDEGR